MQNSKLKKDDMADQSGILGSSIAKKYWMALTGFFLITFLLVHVAGNLQLLDLSQEGRDAFNEYTVFMTTFPVIKVVSYVLYFSILFHAIEGLWLTAQNRKARPKRYKSYRAGETSMWSSRNMGLLGTVILAFIILHMGQFWYQYKWGDIAMTTIDGEQVKDMSTVVIATFTDGEVGLLFTILYVIAQIAIAFHLWHGFESVFQSLGISSKKVKAWQVIGRAFSVIVPLLFAIIPVYIYLNA